MKILTFDIWGKFAHFRKFYTNSSSLTYGIPPRTTVAGIVAAVLGLERDSYYDIFSSDKLHVAVRKITATRKLLQTVNFIKADSPSKLISPKDHTQIPLEIITGDNNVIYRVYLNHEDDSLFDEINSRIHTNDFVYPPYLGSASFNCMITYQSILEGELVSSDKFIKINTVIRTEDIQEINISNYTGRLIKERMPVDFSEERVIKRVTSYIYDENGNYIEARLKNLHVNLSNGEKIVFM